MGAEELFSAAQYCVDGCRGIGKPSPGPDGAAYLLMLERSSLLRSGRHFNDTEGMALLQFLDVNEGRTLELECHHKYLALSAANALIKYVEFSQGGATATRCVIRAILFIIYLFCFARCDHGNEKLEGCLSRSHGTSSDGLCHHRGA